MKSLFLLLFWIGTLLLWIFNVLIPYGTLIIQHIEDVINTGTDISLLLIFKYLLYILGYWILVKLCIWVVTVLFTHS